jgi:4-oxalocrotonate tautomerase
MCGSDVPNQRKLVCELKSLTQSRQTISRRTLAANLSIDMEDCIRLSQGAHMPLARIDLLEGKTPEYRSETGLVVYEAMLACLNVPKDDLFQIITEHPKAELQFDRSYLGIHRTDACIFIQITLNAGRTVEMKQKFYKAVADGLHERLKVRREDVVINLIEVAKENWSFGNGEAQYATPVS